MEFLKKNKAQIPNIGIITGTYYYGLKECAFPEEIFGKEIPFKALDKQGHYIIKDMINVLMGDVFNLSIDPIWTPPFRIVDPEIGTSYSAYPRTFGPESKYKSKPDNFTRYFIEKWAMYNGCQTESVNVAFINPRILSQNSANLPPDGTANKIHLVLGQAIPPLNYESRSE